MARTTLCSCLTTLHTAQTKPVGSGGNASDLYSGGARIICRPRHGRSGALCVF